MQTGVDEAGRGALAGPVVVSAVSLSNEIPGLMDSKQLSEKRREDLFEAIKLNATEMTVAVISIKAIERLNILGASLYGMKRAIQRLSVYSETILIDGNKVPDMPNYALEAIVKGDQKIPAISAASIVAKVCRDRIMKKYNQIYPDYCFDKHKGYATQTHYDMLFEHGVSPIHRRSFNLHRQEPLFRVQS